MSNWSEFSEKTYQFRIASSKPKTIIKPSEAEIQKGKARKRIEEINDAKSLGLYIDDYLEL